MLLWPRAGRVGWAAGALLGVGPFVGYLVSRTVGVPGDPGDVGNWSDWVGTLALVVEATLITTASGWCSGCPRPDERRTASAAPRSVAAPPQLSRL